MSLKGLLQLEIRKDKTNVLRHMGELPPIDYGKFVAAIEKHMPFFIWQEEVNKITPELESFYKEKGVNIYDFNKHRAYCIPVKNETYYRFSVTYLDDWNKIFVVNSAPARMTIGLLEILYDLAELCECKLYYSATRVITRERIENEKALILQRKVKGDQ